MGNTQYHSTALQGETIRQFPSPQAAYQEPTWRANNRIEEDDIVQGHIFWLPPEEELPERAVRIVRGKGTIQDGIYSHPVVITSRPAERGHTVHFQLVRLQRF